jgi:hypothetical protein
MRSTRAVQCAAMPVATQPRTSTNSRSSQDLASEALLEMDQMEELSASEREFLNGATQGKTPETDDEDEEEDDDGVDEEAEKEKGSARPVRRSTRRDKTPPTTTTTNEGGAAAIEKSPSAGIPSTIEMNSNTTESSTLEVPYETPGVTLNINDAIRSRKAENVFHTLTLKMNVYCTNVFRKYKALVGKHKTIKGCFMQDFIEEVDFMNVSRTDELNFLLTTFATQDDWTHDERLVKRLIALATSVINKKRSFVVDELKKQALRTLRRIMKFDQN